MIRVRVPVAANSSTRAGVVDDARKRGCGEVVCVRHPAPITRRGARRQGSGEYAGESATRNEVCRAVRCRADPHRVDDVVVAVTAVVVPAALIAAGSSINT